MQDLMPWWAWIFAGIFIGANIGAVTMSMMVAAKRADKVPDSYHDDPGTWGRQ